MDLLFKRYASPFIFIDSMLISHRFLEFVNELVKTHNEDMQNGTLWELYLHRGYGKTFHEFKEEIGFKDPQQVQKPNTVDIETTIKQSMTILDGFSTS